MFEGVLQECGKGHLGLKYEAACHYNLGVTYRRKQSEARATAEFNKVLEVWPVSEYARRAQAALQKRAKE